MKQIPACASVLNITYSLMHWQRGGSQWDCTNQTQLPLICMHSPLTSLIIQLKIYILLMNYKNIYLPFHTTNTNEHHKRNTDTNYFRLSVLFFTNIIFKNEHVHLFTEMSQSIPNLWQPSPSPSPSPHLSTSCAEWLNALFQTCSFGVSPVQWKATLALPIHCLVKRCSNQVLLSFLIFTEKSIQINNGPGGIRLCSGMHRGAHFFIFTDVSNSKRVHPFPFIFSAPQAGTEVLQWNLC